MYSRPLVYNSLSYASSNIHWFEKFVGVSFVFPSNSGKFYIAHFSASYRRGTGRFSCTVDLETAAARTGRTYFTVCRILAGIDTYLQRLGDVDPDGERSCSIRRGVTAVLQPYYHVLQERRHQARQTTLLILKRNLRNLHLIQRQQKVIQLTLTNRSQGILIISNTYIRVFCYRINVI
jgi:hypothetical protein